jgi:hypothetical protein
MLYSLSDVLQYLNVPPPVGNASTQNANSQASNSTALRLDLLAQAGINVRSSGAPDSIVSDASNIAGSSFFLNSFRSLTMAAGSKGSGQVFTAVGSLTDTGDGGVPKYRELGLYEGTITADSAGAYSAVLEGGFNISAGKPARTNGVAILVNDPNPLANYAATVGATSIYADTGARAFAAQNNGSAKGGTAYHAYGDFVRALLCTFFDQTDNIVESRPQNSANPLFQINGLGAHSWGASGATPVDVTLNRSAAGILSLTGSLYMAGTGVIYLPGGYLDFVGNAFASYVTATAGASGAPPATVAGYFLIVDNNGTSRKVPYYAV